MVFSYLGAVGTVLPFLSGWGTLKYEAMMRVVNQISSALSWM